MVSSTIAAARKPIAVGTGAWKATQPLRKSRPGASRLGKPLAPWNWYFHKEYSRFANLEKRR
jgi:hypothetical protein